MIGPILGAVTFITITIIICITVNICNKREHERYKYNEIKLRIDNINNIYDTGMSQKERWYDILNKIMLEIKEIDKL